MKPVNHYGSTCWIEKRGSGFVIYDGLMNAVRGTESSSLMNAYSQNDLERAYKEKDLYHK